MKTASIKESSTTSKNRTPAFAAEGRDHFFGKQAFFKASTVQAKGMVNNPTDIIENESASLNNKTIPFKSHKPPALASKPLVNRKCAGCEEENLKKNEEEVEDKKEVVQRKPIFESKEIQRKCAACEKEEKIQRKGVDIGTPDDMYEREADEVASAAVGVSKSAGESGLTKRKIQKKAPQTNSSPESQIMSLDMSPDMSQNTSQNGFQNTNQNTSQATAGLNPDNLSSGGSTLSPDLQNYFGSKMGYDFSNVRVHQGSDAAEKNESINAHAFTFGNHIWLGEDQAASKSFLMAHELAHVIQQNPRSISRKVKSEKLSSTKTPYVQRFIFWNELIGSGKPRSGKSAEGILNETVPENFNLQAPIPNADRDGTGLGRKGFADLYKATGKIGVYFVLPQQKVICGSQNLATPQSLKGATQDGTPKLKKGKISEIGTAPSTISLGEVKPASAELIAFGKKQLDYYAQGLKFAAEQVNCWSDQNPDELGNKAQWNLKSIEKFDDSSLPISPDLTYNPSSPKSDRSLGIVDFVGEEGKMLSVRFNPVKKLKRNVMGGIYFMHANDGVIIYFYRPADLPGLISSLGFDPKSQEYLAYIEYATFLQDQVINPLLTAPKKTTPKRKSEKNNPTAPDSKIEKRKIQRASKKPVKLKDDFSLGKWRGSHGKHQSNFKTKKTDTRDKLEFIDLLYKSEEQLKDAKAPSPAKPLPPKSTFDFELGKDKSTGKSNTKNLTNLFDWMHLWSGNPIDYLGRFRDKFGGTFVRIANKFNTLKKKLADKFKSAHKKHSPSGKSYGIIAVRAFWAALLRSSTEVFDNTAQLLAMSLESGLKEKMKDIIPVEGEQFAKMVEDGFPELKEILAKVDSLEAGFAAHIEEVLLQFETEIKTIKEIADEAEKYGKIIKLAMVVIQCGTPPGWGCAKLLASRLIAELVDEIMQWCATQKDFNDIVASTGILDGLPKKLATYTADSFEKIVPGIAPIFDRNVFDTTVFPPPAKIPCDKGPEDVHLAYLELEEEIKNRLGEDGYFLFMMAVDKYGIKSDTEFSASEIRDMKNSVPKDITTEDFQRFLASDFKPEGDGTTFNAVEFLTAIRESRLPDNYTWFYVAHPPSQGHTKGETVQADVTISLYRLATEWTPVMRLTVPAKVLRRISTEKHGLKIYYQPLQDVPFNFFGHTFTIEAAVEFYGFRPDIFRRE